MTIKTGPYGWYATAAIQPDGKIVVLHDVRADLELVRFTRRGTLDTSFGNDGTVRTSLGPSLYAGAYALAVQPDGKIVVVGRGGHGFSLARYTAAGALDTSFGSGGRVLTRLGGVAHAVAFQPDGKIVIAGEGAPARQMEHLVHSGMVARYTTSGTLDPSFGDGGLVTTDEGGIGDATYDAFALQPDGKIVAAGVNNDDGGAELDRYTTNGKLDASFDDYGSAAGASWFPGGYQAVAIQPDGRIVAAGSSDGRLEVDRYTVSGKLDRSFGSGGQVKTSFGHTRNATVYAVAIRAGGTIVAAGSAGKYSRDFTRARLTARGRLDPSFGARGTLTTPFGGSRADVNAVAIEPDGKFVVVALTPNGFVVARSPSD